MASSIQSNVYESFSALLEQGLNSQLLRFTTAGSVDDGQMLLVP